MSRSLKLCFEFKTHVSWQPDWTPADRARITEKPWGIPYWEGGVRVDQDVWHTIPTESPRVVRDEVMPLVSSVTEGVGFIPEDILKGFMDVGALSLE